VTLRVDFWKSPLFAIGVVRISAIVVGTGEFAFKKQRVMRFCSSVDIGGSFGPVQARGDAEGFELGSRPDTYWFGERPRIFLGSGFACTMIVRNGLIVGKQFDSID
jgi:hypothetical protein